MTAVADMKPQWRLRGGAERRGGASAARRGASRWGVRGADST